MDNQKEIIDGFIERIRIELELCDEHNTDEYCVERSFLVSLSDHMEAIIECAKAEYFLMNGNYEMAKRYNKNYRRILKELL